MAVCSCTVLQIPIFKILCLIYLPSAFKINWKISRFKTFFWLHTLALHYKSIELAENWENFELLACKRLTFLFSELKLMVWEAKENFRGFCDFRSFRRIALPMNLSGIFEQFLSCPENVKNFKIHSCFLCLNNKLLCLM